MHIGGPPYQTRIQMSPRRYPQISQWECGFHAEIMACKVWKLLRRLGCHMGSQYLRQRRRCLRASARVCLSVCYRNACNQRRIQFYTKKVVFPEAIIKLSMQTSLPALCALVTVQQTRDTQKKSVCGGGGETCAATATGSDHNNSHVRFK